MSDDPWDTPEMRNWSQHVREELVPKLRASAAMISLYMSTNPDVKFATELGMSVLLDKPIIILVSPGVPVPDHVVRVADRIIEGDSSDPTVMARLRDAVDDLAGDQP